jgi:hypothetical protein
MVAGMRTTLTLDERIAKALREAAHRTGRPFKQVVNDALRAGLAVTDAPARARRYRVNPVGLGGVRTGANIDKALRLADELEDREIAGKLVLRK